VSLPLTGRKKSSLRLCLSSDLTVPRAAPSWVSSPEDTQSPLDPGAANKSKAKYFMPVIAMTAKTEFLGRQSLGSYQTNPAGFQTKPKIYSPHLTNRTRVKVGRARPRETLERRRSCDQSRYDCRSSQGCNAERFGNPAKSLHWS